ncbi:MAG: CHAT domain-containing tetratricopeptide repeat protein [Candidatus Acidiferrales bacterium]
MKLKKNDALSEKQINELAALKDDASRSHYFSRRQQSFRAAAVQQLIDESRKRLRIDTHEALALAEAAVAIARRLRKKEILGGSFRAKANALYNMGENQAALEYHEQALGIFRQAHHLEEQGRTLNSSIQPFCLLGRYEEALHAAEDARTIFTQTGDTRRLGHVEINVGNIYHRQDRFEEGLASYERAYEMLLPHRDSEGLAVALYNMAVCLITLNDFPRALSTYQRAREMFVQHGMTLLVTQSDYNIAYLYYLRGEYSRAIKMLRATREECEKNGDAHMLALCYLDLSEIFLELNLSTDARDTAHEGYLRFQKLGMGYEESKCMANEAMALSQLGKGVAALDLFGKAREKFVREKNLVWPSLIDLYQAVVLCEEGRLFEARRLCKRAAEFFETSILSSKAALCQLLLARLSLQIGDAAAAHRECDRALLRLAKLESPVLAYQAHFLMGQIQHARGEDRVAYDSWQRARSELETLRSSLRGEELKIAFMKNRLQVYENLVDLCLNDPERKNSAQESFGYMELAKSRSLVELLLQYRPQTADVGEGQSGLVRRIREMREELNWYYRRLEIEQLRSEESSPARVLKLEQEALARENELLAVLREMPSSESQEFSGQYSSTSTLESIAACLPPDTALVEYFAVKDQFVAAVVTGNTLEIVPLTPVSRVTNLIRMLRFQMSKFRLGPEYTRLFEKPLIEATHSHLQELFQELIGPLRDRLNAKHLTIVPHGVLHYLPFHALFDGKRYLIDEFSMSYAPSASIYAHCYRKESLGSESPLILGVPDSRAPFIEDEVRAVANALPGSKLVLGPEAGDEALRSNGARSRLIHIATHGMFRQDNPMFSGIRLGASYLNLYDLYHLKLDAQLVTLSGCATGLNVIAAGDELLGLVRGLLYAGAQSLLLTLWDVHDKSTSQFMASFYKRLGASESRASAFQASVQELRTSYPHPYHWAPFALIGKAL